MTSKRAIEGRIERLEEIADRRRSSETELTAEQEAEIEAQIEAMVESLSDDARAAYDAAVAQIEEEPRDAETGDFGLTDGEQAMLDALTGGWS